MKRSALLEKKLAELHAKLNAKFHREENETAIAYLLGTNINSNSWSLNNNIKGLESKILSSKNILLEITIYNDANANKGAIERIIQVLNLPDSEKISVSVYLPNGDYPDWFFMNMEQFTGFIFRFLNWRKAFSLVLKTNTSAYVFLFPEERLMLFQQVTEGT
ncbi:hypothetical protein UNDYM_4096 [Undibacterium sp. YM2]|uniref:hypothetical protein n=1 Tax=Undibacterium sp. YM2 TaxID=2058625 RepID=UPI001331DD20|nr:hypothetical protein [Undibacterium sp. YM2]BBB68349.1 hypothetical protein UNDYM_4096 [Undibacterium sp. YM2]